MTVKQFRSAAEIARKYGQAKLNAGCMLYYHGPQHGWAIHDAAGNTVDIAISPKCLEYLFD
jgi:hypothetical protein